jgi:hypothetical protein
MQAWEKIWTGGIENTVLSEVLTGIAIAIEEEIRTEGRIAQGPDPEFLQLLRVLLELRRIAVEIGYAYVVSAILESVLNAIDAMLDALRMQ